MDRAAYNICMSSPDILIVGGGVIGLSTAYFLARAGVQVEVIDKSDFGQEASWAGAGILPPGNPARARAPYDQLRAHSSALFPTLSAELRERTGIDNGYLRCGGIEFPQGAGDLLEEAWRDEGIAYERLDATACRRLEPALLSGERQPADQVVFHLPDLAQVRNPRHIKALLAGCQSFGVS